MTNPITGVIQFLTIPLLTICFAGTVSAQPYISGLVRGNTAFALDLYAKLRSSEGNLFIAPHSISTALGMAFGGARGNTEKEMAATFRFSLKPRNLHPAFAELQSRLNKLQEIGAMQCSLIFSAICYE